MLKKYNIAAKKSKSAQEEILVNSLCGSMPAEKLGYDQHRTTLCKVLNQENNIEDLINGDINTMTTLLEAEHTH